MAGTCYLFRGSDEDALLAWTEAVNTGMAMKRPARTPSTLMQAAGALRDLLIEVGLMQHAADVGSYIQALSGDRREGVCL